MKINVRNLLIIPAMLTAVGIRYQIEVYNYIISQKECYNFVGTTIPCSGITELYFIAILSFIFLVSIYHMLRLDKKIKWLFE